MKREAKSAVPAPPMSAHTWSFVNQPSMATSNLFRFDRRLVAALQPAHADQIADPHHHPIEVRVLGRAAMSWPMIHFDKAHAIALTHHQRDEIAVNVVEVGK